MHSISIRQRFIGLAAILLFAVGILSCIESGNETSDRQDEIVRPGVVSAHRPLQHDRSPTLASMAPSKAANAAVDDDEDAEAEREAEEEAESHALALAPQNLTAQTTQQATQPETEPATDTAPATRGRGRGRGPIVIPRPTVPAGSIPVEQTQPGDKPAPVILASFEGLGFGFEGPQGTARLNNPSDNSLAVGPDHIVQIVNSRMAVFTKKGAKYDTTGKVLYGPVNTNNVFKGFGDAARINGGDAVVRYDQLADRWLIVMPIFSRLPVRENEPTPGRSGEPAQRSQPAVTGQPGSALTIEQPPPATEPATTRGRGRGRGTGTQPTRGSYAMCYAISTGPDPLGSYYRYEFVRPLFPDYPRPAVWPDGYYVPSSTGDTVIQKQAFVVDRAKMLKGQDATEQGVIIDGVNFLNNADIDGKQLPPPGAPNILMAAGGFQLGKILADGSRGEPIFEDDGIYVWKYHVDWDDPAKTILEGPTKVQVAPYHYMGNGQLTNAVPQPGTPVGLDAQGDKLMQRLVYRRIGSQESILAAHSIATSAFGGGVRWYEFRLNSQRDAQLFQQGTYCPDGFYRWMPSAAMDSLGNIGIGYSFGGTPNFAGQRFAGRLAGDPLGQLTLHEAVLAEGHAAQTNTNRWEDYATTCMDPSDDRTLWYVGDYLKEGATAYSSRIGAFRLGGN